MIKTRAVGKVKPIQRPFRPKVLENTDTKKDAVVGIIEDEIKKPKRTRKKYKKRS